LQDDVHAFGDVVGDERGHADAEVDVEAIAEFLGNAAGDAFAFLVVGHKGSLQSTVYSHQPNLKSKAPV